MTIQMSSEKLQALGKTIKEALPHNMIVAAFSAELIEESYPLTKSMWDIVFSGYTDEELGQKFVQWQEKKS